MPDHMTTFYIVRHGETEYNVGGVVQGHSDSPLTENGIKQAQALRTTFKDVHFDTVFSSDLLRTQKTAEIIVLERKLIINTSKLLRERNYGRFDGGPAKAFREENKVMLEKIKTLSFEESRKVKFAPDVESDEEICNRLILFLREAAVTYTGKTLLVVAHAGIMRAFLLHLGWATVDELPGGSVKNTGYIKVRSDGVDFVIEKVEGVVKKIL